MNKDVIVSKDNPLIKLYQKLASSKKERLLYGSFVLEGLRIVADAIAEEAIITQILITETAYWKYGEELPYNSIRTVIISDGLGKKISQTETTQGVFAICRIPENAPKLSKNGRYAVIHNLQDPGNVGTIIRTADALGIDGVLLCGSCDVFSPKVIRSTMGSVFRVKLLIENDVDRLFEMLTNSGITSFASVLDDKAIRVGRFKFQGGCAVFIGNEGNGLPHEISERCDRKITVPMNGSTESLNAAIAAGILMWEMRHNDE